MRFILVFVVLLLGCETSIPHDVVRQQNVTPDRRVRREHTRSEQQAYNCSKTCVAARLRVSRFVVGSPPTCECSSPIPRHSQHAQHESPGVIDGIAVGVGMEVGKSAIRGMLR